MSSSVAKIRLAFRSGMQGAKDKMTFLIESRKWLPHTLFLESLEWIGRQPKIAYAQHAPFPKVLSELAAYTTYAPTSYKRELEWFKALITLNKNKLQYYVDIRNSIQVLILKGDFVGADNSIESVSQHLGFSFWWLKHSLAIKQLAYGIEAHKRFSAYLKSAFPARSITRYIIQQISIRNEPSVTPARFTAQINENVDAFPFAQDYKEKILYHINGHVSSGVEGAMHVLRHSNADSIIDSYESFIYLAQITYSTNSAGPEKQQVIDTLDYLSSIISDQRLNSLLFVLTGGGKGELLLGRDVPNENASEYDISKLDERYLLSIGQYLLAATSTVSTPFIIDKSPITKYLAGVFSKVSETDVYATELEKLSMSLPSFELVYVQQAFMKREMSSGLIPLADIHNAETDKDIKFAIASCITFHPFILKYLSNDLIKVIEEKLASEYPAFTGYYEYANKEGLYKDAYKNEEIYVSSLKAFGRAEYELTIEIAMQLINSGVEFYKFSAVRLIIHSLMQESDLSTAIQLATSTYLANKESVHILPIRGLADRLNKNLRREMKADLSLTILYDIYTRTIDGVYEGLLRQAVGTALFGNGVTKPSELKKRTSDFDQVKLIYFLRYTCLPEYIHMAGDYSEGTSSLLAERIAILNWLIELDPIHRAAYEAETVDLTRRLVLQERRVEVEQSKIEYNPDGLIREAEKIVRENFDRYVTYVRAGIDEQPNEFASVSSSKSGSPLLPVALPIDEVSDLLRVITEDMLDIFIKDRNYGMDGFLSTRIRHNELESEMLRGC